MSISLISTGTPGIILNWNKIVLPNYNFISDFTSWAPAGGTVIATEGINSSKCAKLPNQYDGLYRYITILANKWYKLEAILKVTTTSNVTMGIQSNDGSIEYAFKYIENSNNYNLQSLEFKCDTTAVRIAFEVYPGSGSMCVNEIRLYIK